MTRRAAAPTIDSDKPDDWREQSKCRDYDPEMWFPVSSGPERQVQVAMAAAICRRCPVQWDCGNWALDTGEQFGIWGGMDEAQRRGILWHRREQEASDA